ncbi:MAG: hypothetical protein HY276_01480 [Ignavibacteriales bacterium]|nr:hypothetical protein [Ignavibacteriales bacterium]
MPKSISINSRIAKHGEKMIQINVCLWTDNISSKKGEIIEKYARASGVVRLQANKAHKIRPKSPTPFNSLLELTAAIEKVLIQHDIKLYTSGKAQKYIVCTKP